MWGEGGIYMKESWCQLCCKDVRHLCGRGYANEHGVKEQYKAEVQVEACG